jgi:hypothetical protein
MAEIIFEVQRPEFISEQYLSSCMVVYGYKIYVKGSTCRHFHHRFRHIFTDDLPHQNKYAQS